MSKIKTTNHVLFVIFFAIAGANHLINPQFYLPLIPDYLPYPDYINYGSGLLEIVIAILAILSSAEILLLFCPLLSLWLLCHHIFILYK